MHLGWLARFRIIVRVEFGVRIVVREGFGFELGLGQGLWLG